MQDDAYECMINIRKNHTQEHAHQVFDEMPKYEKIWCFLCFFFWVTCNHDDFLWMNAWFFMLSMFMKMSNLGWLVANDDVCKYLYAHKLLKCMLHLFYMQNGV